MLLIVTFRDSGHPPPSQMYRHPLLNFVTADLTDLAEATTPRRSPRIKEKNSTYDIYVHDMNNMKVSTTSNVIDNVNQSADLKEITTLLKGFESNNMLYNPASRLYWLRKRGKQPVRMANDQDLV